MPNIIETLQQDEWWYGRDGFPYRLREMPTSHIENVLEWLRRRASQLRLQHYWDEFLEHHDLDDEGIGPSTQGTFHEWLRHQNALEADDGRTWLEQTPFIRALQRVLRRRNTVNGDVVDVRYDEELEDVSGTDGRAVAADPRLRDRPALG